MHVITSKKLREFWQDHPDAETPLRAWLREAENSSWENFAAVRKSYPHADLVGHLTVFNVGGNKYRLVVAVHHNRNTIYVRHVLTHRGYDKGAWKNE